MLVMYDWISNGNATSLRLRNMEQKNWKWEMGNGKLEVENGSWELFLLFSAGY